MTDAQIRENLKKFRMLMNPIQPFSVFRDAELDELVRAKPKTIKELSRLKGFPENGQRVSKYGKDIVGFFKGGCIVDNLSAF